MYRRDRLPTLVVEDIAVDRVSEAKMQEQRREECERDIVEKIYREIKILAEIQRVGKREIRTPRGRPSRNAARKATGFPA